MKNINWDAIEEAKDFEKLPAGGYVCVITAVEDVPEKEYLRLEYDIAEGPRKGHYKTLYHSRGFWGGSFIRSYKPAAQSFFKGFLTAVQQSNPGYVFKNEEATLRGKLAGLVLGEEEYKGNDGSIKTRLYVDQIRSVDAIRKGEFKVPPFKALPKENPAFSGGFTPAAPTASGAADTLPWG